MDCVGVDAICPTGIGDPQTPPPPMDVIAAEIITMDRSATAFPLPPPPLTSALPATKTFSTALLMTTPTLQRRSYGSSNKSSSDGGSPDTEEFESLERRLHEELEQKLQERKISVTMATAVDQLSPTGGKLSSAQLTAAAAADDDELVSLQLVEKRQLRSFSRADEYLYAMKEDLGRLQC